MNGKTKNKNVENEQTNSVIDKDSGNPTDKPAVSEHSTWQKDIESRGYYYDDSAGYEIYNPAEDDENDEN